MSSYEVSHEKQIMIQESTTSVATCLVGMSYLTVGL